MLCENCKTNIATTHIKQNINGQLSEHMLCRDCAERMGFSGIMPGFGLDFGSFLGGVFAGALPERSALTRCKMCGSSFADISDSGKLGCPECYAAFYQQLIPTVRRIHGNTAHVGKVPTKSEASVKPQNISDTIQVYKKELQEAIDKQDFENAARLRDIIKEAEASGNDKS